MAVKNTAREQLWHRSTVVDQVFGKFLQRSVDRCEAVEKADGEITKKIFSGHMAMISEGLSPFRTRDQVGERDGEQTDVDLGFVAEGDCDNDSRDDEQAHHDGYVLLCDGSFSCVAKPNSFAALVSNT